jgi:hypothetical protein
VIPEAELEAFRLSQLRTNILIEMEELRDLKEELRGYDAQQNSSGASISFLRVRVIAGDEELSPNRSSDPIGPCAGSIPAARIPVDTKVKS